MRFLVDQDVYAATLAYLRALGHDVVSAAELGLARATDETLLERAQEQNRILVTRDRDYGSLVFLKSLGAGVIYLRVHPSTQEAVHSQLAAVLREHVSEELGKAFVVVEPGGYRVRAVDREMGDAQSRKP